jgi:hypothetical protein
MSAENWDDRIAEWGAAPRSDVRVTGSDWRGLSRAGLAALTTGQRPTVEQVRAIAVCTGASLARLANLPMVTAADGAATFDCRAPANRNADEARMTSALVQAFYLALPPPPPKAATPAAPRFSVSGDGPADAGGLLPQVVVFLGLTAGLAYAIHEAAAVIETAIKESERTQQTALQLLSTLKIVEDHHDREDATGQTLPLDDTEKAALSVIEKTSLETAKRTDPPGIVVAPTVTAGGAGVLVAFALAAVFLLK